MRSKLGILLIIVFFVVGCRPKTLTSPAQTATFPDEYNQLITPENQRSFQTIVLNDKELYVEVADSPKKIETGLSYCDEIGADGMLFVMDRRAIPTFWVKGMVFPLDMLWIDCDFDGEVKAFGQVQVSGTQCQIVDVTRNALAPKQPMNTQTLPIYSPRFPVTHVLEVNAGWWDVTNLNKD